VTAKHGFGPDARSADPLKVLANRYWLTKKGWKALGADPSCEVVPPKAKP